jgi:hypothetical protein
MSGFHQAARDIRAHSAKTDYSDLHVSSSVLLSDIVGVRDIFRPVTTTGAAQAFSIRRSWPPSGLGTA